MGIMAGSFELLQNILLIAFFRRKGYETPDGSILKDSRC